ncbi:MAG TPA: YidB family protein [Candidatus Binatia bacterium]|jgi:uncharacterized protein YidB (DUF937 family)|nr:YidB family protein [Candidatus Binatia bacterium]
MGLLDDLLGNVLGKDTEAAAGRNSGMAQAMLDLLNDPRVGGVDGLARQFQQNGLGDLVKSWIGTGQNEPISPDQVTQALGPERLGQVADRSGVSGSMVPALLAQLLPVLIDRLTPDGNVPKQDQLTANGLDLLKRMLA